MSRQSRDIFFPDDPFPEQLPDSKAVRTSVEGSDACHESDDPEMTLKDREFEGWEDVESDDLSDDNTSDNRSSEDDDL